jgi:hypothetical protein
VPPDAIRIWISNPINFTTGIELYGGVTPYHPQFRLQRWVSEVKAICAAFESAMVVMDGEQDISRCSKFAEPKD